MSEDNHKTTLDAIPRAVFAGQVDFGTGPVDCYTTGDGLSLLTTRGIVQILAGVASGGLKRLVSGIHLESSGVSLVQPIRFRLPTNNAIAQGYPASILMDLCDAIEDADEAGLLQPNQMPLVQRVKVLSRGLRRRSVDALIWEATGYEKYKEADAHQRRLLMWLREEAGVWAKLFPDEFYLELGKLYRLHLPVPGRRPSVFAAFTSEFVYRWFDKNVCPGAYTALTERNPDPTLGTRHHQFLTDDARRAVAQHIAVVVALMRASSAPDDFRMRFNAVFNNAGLQLALPN